VAEQPTIDEYHLAQEALDQAICESLRSLIDQGLPEAESKVWHRHPVWFLDGNPTVGYSKQKRGVRLMFWSGADFGDVDLIPGTGKFKDASIFYTDPAEIDSAQINRWLKLSRTIRWDYQNLAKRKGKLVRIEITAQ